MTRILALSAVLLLAGCAGSDDPGSDGPRLRMAADGDSGFGLGIPGAGANEPWVIQGLIVCLDGEGTAELQEIRTVDSDLEVTDFALRDNPLWPGGDTFGVRPRTDRRGSLTDAGFDPRGKVASLGCSGAGSGRGHELAIQLSHPESTPVGSVAFEVVYESGGDQRTLMIPMQLALCPHPTHLCRVEVD